MIAAIIILYHPDLEAVGRLIATLAGQVDSVLAIDNTPGSAEGKSGLFTKQDSFVTYIPLGENVGIAAAQNIGIQFSINKGYSHVLLLDQDSLLPAGFVNLQLKAEERLLKRGEKVAVVAPQILDEKTGKRPCAVTYRWMFAREQYAKDDSTEPIQSDNLISSGSLIRTQVLLDIGLMRSELFIEYVDTEWIFRAQQAGYRGFCVPEAVMMHSFGDDAATAFGKCFFLYSNSRYYYKLRNEIYLTRLKTMGWRWRTYALSRIPYHFFLYAALASNRGSAFRLLLTAVFDGIFARLGPLNKSFSEAGREK